MYSLGGASRRRIGRHAPLSQHLSNHCLTYYAVQSWEVYQHMPLNVLTVGMLVSTPLASQCTVIELALKGHECSSLVILSGPRSVMAEAVPFWIPLSSTTRKGHEVALTAKIWLHTQSDEAVWELRRVPITIAHHSYQYNDHHSYQYIDHHSYQQHNEQQTQQRWSMSSSQFSSQLVAQTCLSVSYVLVNTTGLWRSSSMQSGCDKQGGEQSLRILLCLVGIFGV